MAENGNGKVSPILWAVLAFVVLWVLMSRRAPTPTTTATQRMPNPGNNYYGAGYRGGPDSTGSAIGEFIGGLIKGGAAGSSSSKFEDEEGEFDTSSFRVYDD